MKDKITIYTKFCLPCVWESETKKLKQWASANNYEFEIKRTAYRPDWHKKATELWGNQYYRAFMVMPDGKVEDFVKFFNGAKCKPARAGKAKGNYDLFRLHEAEGANREDSLGVENGKIKTQNEEEINGDTDSR